MNPTERLLTILRLVSETNGRSMEADGALIRKQMAPVYEGPSGRRMWRRDLRTLRERGLVESDRTTPATPNRRGIRASVLRKPEHLHLTAGEHAAITRARRMLRRGISSASPLGAPRERHGQIDSATRIVRYLEENEDEVELTELANHMGLSEDEVFELLDLLTTESVVRGGLVTTVAFEYGYDDDPNDGDPSLPATVRVIRGQSVPRRSPTRGRGMDELGFFPYSLAETEDRLTLIGEALNSAALGEADLRALPTAEQKLVEWREYLQRQGAMS